MDVMPGAAQLRGHLVPHAHAPSHVPATNTKSVMPAT
ncbi:hypothetical protein SVIOM74S_00262 [Streptomyces violarus]